MGNNNQTPHQKENINNNAKNDDTQHDNMTVEEEETTETTTTCPNNEEMNNTAITTNPVTADARISPSSSPGVSSNGSSTSSSTSSGSGSTSSSGDDPSDPSWCLSTAGVHVDGTISIATATSTADGRSQISSSSNSTNSTNSTNSSHDSRDAVISHTSGNNNNNHEEEEETTKKQEQEASDTPDTPLPSNDRVQKVSSSSSLSSINKTSSSPSTTTTTSERIDKALNIYSKFASNATMTERGIKLIQWSTWLLSYLTKAYPQNFTHLPKETSSSLRKFYSELSMMRYVLRLYGMPLAYAGTRSYGCSWAGSPPSLPSILSTAWDDMSVRQQRPHDSFTNQTSCKQQEQLQKQQQHKQRLISLLLTKKYTNQWNNPTIQKLSHIMTYCMLFYHPLEHVAYAQWTMPKLLTKKRTGIDGNKLSAYSCQFWLVYIIADWITSHLKNKELYQRREWLREFQRVLKMKINMIQRKKLTSIGTTTSSTTSSRDTNGSSLVLQEEDSDQQQQHYQQQEQLQAIQILIQTIEKDVRMNQLQMIRCALFTCPCLNWALPNWATDPLFSEQVVNGSSWMEAVVCMYQSIYSMI